MGKQKTRSGTTDYFRRLDINYLMEEKPCVLFQWEVLGTPKQAHVRSIFVETPTMANGEVRPYGDFYRMQPEIGHIHTFECIVRIAPPYGTLGKLDDQEATGI